MEIDLTKLERDLKTLPGSGGYVLVSDSLGNLGIKRCVCVCHTQQGVMHIVQCCQYPGQNKKLQFQSFQIPENYKKHI